MPATWPLKVRPDRRRPRSVPVRAYADGAELGLLEIHRDRDVARHEHYQRLPDRGVIALRGGQLRHITVDRRGDDHARPAARADHAADLERAVRRYRSLRGASAARRNRVDQAPSSNLEG